MEEKNLYTPEQLEKLKKLRQLSDAERRTKKDLLESNKRFSEQFDSILEIDEKVFYKQKIGVISAREKKTNNSARGFYYLYTVKSGIETFENVQRFQITKRVVPNYDHVEVTDQIKDTPTKKLLSWYRRISYSPGYWPEDYVGQPENLELQLKAELSRREHVPSKREGQKYRSKKTSKKK